MTILFSILAILYSVFIVTYNSIKNWNPDKMKALSMFLIVDVFGLLLIYVPLIIGSISDYKNIDYIKKESFKKGLETRFEYRVDTVWYPKR